MPRTTTVAEAIHPEAVEGDAVAFGRGGRGPIQNERRLDAWFIQCTDGSRLEVHLTYHFDNNVWLNIPSHIQEDLTTGRRAMNQQNNYHQQLE